VSRATRLELPRWLSSSSVAWIGALLSVLAIALGSGFVWHQQREIHDRELQSSELLVRALEDQGNRTFGTVDIALSTLAETVRDNERAIDPARLGPTLAKALQGLPFLRSLSVMDAHGRVLASTSIENVDEVVDLQRVPLPANGATDRLGTLVAGRDLVDAAVSHKVRAADAGTRSFVPLVRSVSDSTQATLYLVAVLNPDYLANAFQLMLSDPGRSAALFGIDGTLLAATDAVQLAPGVRIAAHPFFARYLPARESGSYIGAGIDGSAVVTAFRTLRQRPMAVIVQREYASVRAEVVRIGAWVAAACGVALLVIATLLGMAWRSLRSFEAVQGALDSTRERVEASERDLRTLVESVHELIFRTDANGCIRFVNERWQQISGHAGATVVGRRLAELCLPADRAQIDALFDDGAPASDAGLMVQIRTRHGELRTLEVSVAAVRATDGSLHGFAGFAVDVTERQRARDRLQAQLDFTARLLEISPAPLFVKDEQGRYASVNQAWLELVGLTREQAIGRRAEELFGGASSSHLESDQRLLQADGSLRYDRRLTRPGGDARDTVVTKARFTHADGTPAGIIGSVIDVTEFREAERRTREAQLAAERANRAKSEFIANISHELRTPLQAIIGFSELGADLSDAQPEFHEMFDDIQAGGQRMLRLVNGLLDVSKMDSSAGSLSIERHDLARLAEEVVRELRPMAAARGLTVALPQPLPQASADVDAQRIQQVIRNVLANAIRFAPAGSRIDLDVETNADGVELRVRDHGPGIPTDELEMIFEAFVQSSRTRDGSGGTGLGLTICRKIMGAHGGSIVAANAPGGGALLRVRLPACGTSIEARQTVDLDHPAPTLALSEADAG